MPDYRADEIHPPAGRFDVELLERASAQASPTSPRRSRTSSAAGACAGAASRRPPAHEGERAARSPATWPSTRPRAPSRPAGCCTASPPTRSTPPTCASTSAASCAPRSSSTRERQAPRTAPRARAIPRRDVETDWNPAALAIRARRAMGTGERGARPPHDGTAHVGRVVRLAEPAERDDTTLAVELDSGARVHLADVASIGPATRRARRRDRRDPRLAACAHAFGYRGHCLTKSRRYSTTFKALRAGREAFVHAQILARSTDATQRAIAAATPTAHRDLRVRRRRARNSCRCAVWRLRRRRGRVRSARRPGWCGRWSSSREVRGERDGHNDWVCAGTGQAIAAIIAGDESGLRAAGRAAGAIPGGVRRAGVGRLDVLA